MTLFAIALAFSGFTALCLAMEKHQLELYGKDKASPARMRAWRIAGWVLLTVAFALCVVAGGWAIGPVMWLGALTAGAVVVALWLLPYRPNVLLPAAVGAPVVAGVLWLVS